MVSVSFGLETAEKVITKPMHSALEDRDITIDVPNIFPSDSGEYSISCMTTWFNPNVVMGITKATTEAAKLIKPKLDGPRYLAVNMDITMPNIDCIILHAMIQLALAIILFLNIFLTLSCFSHQLILYM